MLNKLAITSMQETINKLVVKEKGILAIDESIATIGKRFNAINLENNQINRAKYRSLLATTGNLSKYISGVILFEETLTQPLIQENHQKTNHPSECSIAEKFVQEKILVGLKVDQGLTPIFTDQLENCTKGLDLLLDHLNKYKNCNISFAKWRGVIKIDSLNNLPSNLAITINSQQLARYAAICQSMGIVPIVEPEVLMDGTHDLDLCANITEQVLLEVFKELRKHQVTLEYMLLKPNMILPGKDCSKTYTNEQIAVKTLTVLKRTVPAVVPSINFLSGGQTATEATLNLNAINKLGIAPWNLSFSFGRALQENCLKAWQGKEQNIEIAQKMLLESARLNSLANLGMY